MDHLDFTLTDRADCAAPAAPARLDRCAAAITSLARVAASMSVASRSTRAVATASTARPGVSDYHEVGEVIGGGPPGSTRMPCSCADPPSATTAHARHPASSSTARPRSPDDTRANPADARPPSACSSTLQLVVIGSRVSGAVDGLPTGSSEVGGDDREVVLPGRVVGGACSLVTAANIAHHLPRWPCWTGAGEETSGNGVAYICQADWEYARISGTLSLSVSW